NRRDEAVAALGRIAQTSNLYVSAQKSIATALLHGTPGITELGKAAQTIEALVLEGIEKFRMVRDLLAAAIARLDGGVAEDPTMRLLGHPFEQRHIRIGLENAYRNMAHLETEVARKVELVDLANQVRPKTWV
ncbi:MAG TPA: tetratricopeptide repeat protein, partial [Kofleriaceae bacterium]|nr:tetratricopeptide repeat protein [Kofleriaceae bacterium]